MELQAMRSYFSNRRVRVFALACALGGAPVSAIAQGGQSFAGSAQSALQQVAAQPGDAVRRLSLDEAATLAVEQNLGIRIQRFDPQIQDTGVALARSSW